MASLYFKFSFCYFKLLIFKQMWKSWINGAPVYSTLVLLYSCSSIYIQYTQSTRVLLYHTQHTLWYHSTVPILYVQYCILYTQYTVYADVPVFTSSSRTRRGESAREEGGSAVAAARRSCGWSSYVLKFLINKNYGDFSSYLCSIFLFTVDDRDRRAFKNESPRFL